MANAEPKPRTSIYETTIEHDELEAALEERQGLKVKKGEADKAYNDVDKKVKGIIATLDLADAPVRIGDFVVTQREIPGKTVTFETSPSTRVYISPLDEEA